MKIDAFCHRFSMTFYERMLTLPEQSSTINERLREIPSSALRDTPAGCKILRKR
jgi:hypothetical protein